ncbi:hypothetical protein BKD30_04265 [Tersicoccus phoenicis]|uniref:Uncharacterized protein n=1 Tax=Tersicoccus phoenicis TaxID=554083 RepID=A0A1R1LHK8_9MICC|nr:methyltransferase [Tersicoccus phoenicis]OMH27000.1 hypothetical protein BKD30_04265 [Tersicoccus phoenicis]
MSDPSPATSSPSTVDVLDAPRADDPAALARLVSRFAAATYTVDGVRDLIGEDAAAALDRDETVPAELATARVLADADSENRTRAALSRLLLLGLPVPIDAFGADTAADLVACGVAEPVSAEPVVAEPVAAVPTQAEPAEAGATLLRARVDLRPYEADDATRLWVAADLGALQTDGPLRHDHVLGIGRASLTLAQVTDRRPVETALDLGTGCGIQTFHLLRHARHVTATDLSARALAYTRFNLLLNAAALDLDPADLSARVELRQGSLLEPVANETFDLIVSNPPFVITPRAAQETTDSRYTYRDGGQTGDRLVTDLVRTLPAHLADGGTAQLLGNWEIPAGATWDDTVTSAWFAPHGGAPGGEDGLEWWVIQRDTQSPAEYAELWLRDAAQAMDPDGYRRAYAAYLADFAARDVAAIGFGMIWLRRPGTRSAGEPLRRLESLIQVLDQPLGPAIGATIARHDRLAGLDDAGLAGLRLVVAPDVTEERHGTPGATDPTVILLRQGGGFRRTVQASTALAGFVGACDGELTVGQLIAALTALLGPEDLGFAGTLLGQVRCAVVDGFLLPLE